jgi:hypothetical protein
MSFAGRMMAVALVLVLGFVVYWAYGEYRNTTRPDAVDLERALAKAKDDCVHGPPMGPACVEAARLTTAIAERRR